MTFWILCVLSDRLEELELGDKVGGHAMHGRATLFRHGAERPERIKPFGSVDDRRSMGPCSQIPKNKTKAV